MRDFSFLDSTKKLKRLWILDNIYNNPEISQKKLADKINVSKGMIHRYLHNLLDDNYLKKNRHKFTLTIKGKKTLQNLKTEYYKEILALEEFLNKEIEKYKNNSEVNLKIGIIKSLNSILPYLSKELGVLDKYPINMSINIFKDGQDLMENFTSDNYDLGFLGIVPAFLWKSNGANIKIEAKINKGGHAIIARENIKNIRDLDKSRVLISRKNESVSDNLLKKVARNFNINVVRIDLHDLDLNLNDLIYEFENLDYIDALLLWEPYLTFLLEKYDSLYKIYDFSIEDNEYTSNVMISQKDNITDIKLSLIEDILKETIIKIEEKSKFPVEDLQDIFEVDKRTLIKALNNIKFKYEKWEE